MWHYKPAWVWSGSLYHRGKSILFSMLLTNKYDDVLDLVKSYGQELKLELNVLHHGFKGFLGFVLISWQEKQDSLLVKVIGVVLNFLFETVGVKLFEFFLFVIVMLNLSVKIKPGSFFVETCLLLLLLMMKALLLGKNLYARLSKLMGCSAPGPSMFLINKRLKLIDLYWLFVV